MPMHPLPNPSAIRQMYLLLRFYLVFYKPMALFAIINILTTG